MRDEFMVRQYLKSLPIPDGFEAYDEPGEDPWTVASFRSIDHDRGIKVTVEIMDYTAEIAASDPRVQFNTLLIEQGYTLDRRFEGISGLRVYRKNLSEDISSNSVDLFKDGAWGKYGANNEYVKGKGVESLRETFNGDTE